jgi:3-methyladenine DNA glycosylase AlkD
MTKLRKQLSPLHLKKLLKNAEGWAEVDSICQSNFTSKELLGNWEEWKKVLNEFNKSENIHKRRASLVLLIKSLRESEDKRLTDMAFKNIEKIKKEDHKLITKAISWILREMIKKHRNKVEKYLKENKETLPAIAVRETTKKLKTGKK